MDVTHAQVIWYIKTGNLKLLELIKEKYNFKIKEYFYLAHAAENNQLEILKFLIGIGCDPTVNNNKVIRLAVQNNHVVIVDFLIKNYNCDPTVDDYYGIIEAAQKNHLEIIKYLIIEFKLDPKLFLFKIRNQNIINYILSII